MIVWKLRIILLSAQWLLHSSLVIRTARRMTIMKRSEHMEEKDIEMNKEMEEELSNGKGKEEEI